MTQTKHEPKAVIHYTNLWPHLLFGSVDEHATDLALSTGDIGPVNPVLAVVEVDGHGVAEVGGDEVVELTLQADVSDVVTIGYNQDWLLVCNSQHVFQVLYHR